MQVYERAVQPPTQDPYETSYSDGPGYTTDDTGSINNSFQGGFKAPSPAYSKYIAGGNPFLPTVTTSPTSGAYYVVETSYVDDDDNDDIENNVYLGSSTNNLTPATTTSSVVELLSNEIDPSPPLAPPIRYSHTTQDLTSNSLLLTPSPPPRRPPPPPPSSFGPASLLRLTPSGPTVPVLSQLSSDLDAAVRGAFGIHQGKNAHLYRNRFRGPQNRFKVPKQDFTSRYTYKHEWKYLLY